MTLRGVPDADRVQLGFLNGSEMGVLMRARNWHETPLGSPQQWPQPLKTLVGVMLSSVQPMFVAWGCEGTLLYNDAYAPLLAGRHPEALGRPFLDVWEEVRADLTPLVEQVFAGHPVHMDDLALQLDRRGKVEEAHFAFSYTPVQDETGEVAGLFCACSETTGQVLAEKRRTEQTERLREMFAQAPGFIAMLRGPDHIFELTNAAYMQLVGHRPIVGQPVRDALPEVQGQGFFELLDGVFQTGKSFVGRALPADLQRTPGGVVERRFLDLVYQPITMADGSVTGIFVEGSDVTERVLAEADLRESEERSRRIAEGVRDYAIFTTDLAGVITDWMPGAEEVFGWRADEIKGRSADLLFTPSDIAAGVPAIELANARENGCANDERWHVRRDGSHFFANGSVRPLHGGNDDIIGFIKIARDETKRRSVEARLRASEEFNRRILASSADCIKVLDLEGKLEFLSEGGMCAMEVDDFGAIEGSSWPDFWPGDKHADALSAIKEAKAGGTARFQGLAPTMKGSMRWWDVIVTPITDEDGRSDKLLSISRDVTATKQAEEALRELNATLESRVASRTSERNMLSSILESSEVMVLACSLDYTIVAINKANVDEFERIYGVRPAAGDNMLALLADQPGHQAEVRAAWERGVAEEELTFIDDFGDPSRGRPHHEVSFRALRNDLGERVGTYQFVTDVTDRLREQAQLAEAQEALRQSQKLEAMGQLTGGVSHDFNNLLTPIIGSLDLLQRTGVGNARQQRLIDGALQSAERAKTLVQRLLAFARRQPLQAEAVDIGALVDGMADLVASTSGPRVRMDIELAPELPAAKADANQLEMALLNLAVNARDAMPDGGTLTISAEPCTMARGNRLALAPGSYVRLAVGDTGVGMNEETLARAIEPFFSTKGVGRGTGLGLSMVHGLAAQLGGSLEITSKPASGTTVALWLPTTEDAVAPPAGVEQPESVAGVGRVLLVDDEELVRASTADMLSELGYAVVEAGCAEEALRLIEEGTKFDLLVTDHLMPGLTGTELAQLLRGRRPGMPTLIISGYAEVEGIAADLPRLTKPFRQVDLAASMAGLSAEIRETVVS